MAEKDFARGQERAGAAAIEQFRVGIADNRPTPAVRFCPQHESLGYGDIGNIDRAFQVFVTERSDANAVSSCCDIIELETAIGTAALFAKKPQIGREQGYPRSGNRIAGRTLLHLAGNWNSANLQRHGQSHAHHQQARGFHAGTVSEMGASGEPEVLQQVSLRRLNWR
jgi:hypothetical protein